MSKPSQSYPAPRTIARLARQRQRHHITLQQVADEAAKTSRRPRGTVGITTVSKVLGCHAKSLNVLDALRRLLAQVAPGNGSPQQQAGA